MFIVSNEDGSLPVPYLTKNEAFLYLRNAWVVHNLRLILNCPDGTKIYFEGLNKLVVKKPPMTLTETLLAMEVDDYKPIYGCSVIRVEEDCWWCHLHPMNLEEAVKYLEGWRV